MGSSTTRASLFERLRDPVDQAAWFEFERRYRDLVLGYARRVGLPAWDAEDLLQTWIAWLDAIRPSLPARLGKLKVATE
jgi:hypothetical protein